MLGVQIALYFLLLDKIAEFHKDIWTMTIQSVVFPVLWSVTQIANI